MKTSIGQQYKLSLTIKETETEEAIQFICDDIVDDFMEARDLKDSTSWLTVTLNQSYVDISSALADLYGNRITSVVLRNTANNDDDRELDEIDFEECYLGFNPDADNPDSEHYGLPYEYARYKDKIYLKWVPDESTYELKVYFEKNHPTVSASQDIVFPADFKACILHGCLWYLYSFVERKDGLAEKHQGLYESLKEKKIRKYTHKPDTEQRIETDWFGMTSYGYRTA